jgi:hypothetical protein
VALTEGARNGRDGSGDDHDFEEWRSKSDRDYGGAQTQQTLVEDELAVAGDRLRDDERGQERGREQE